MKGFNQPTISEFRQAPTQTGDAELTTIFETAPVCIVSYRALENATGQVIDFQPLRLNQRAVDVCGLDRERILASTLLNLFPQLQDSALLADYQAVVQTGESRRNDYFIPPFGGWFDVSVSRVKAGEVAAVFIGIPDHKRIEALQAQKAELLQTIMDTAPMGLVLYEAIRDAIGRITDFRYQLVNAEGSRLMGRSMDDIQTNTLLGLFPETTSEGHIFGSLLHVMQTGECRQTEFSTTLNGATAWFDGYFIRQGNGVLYTFQDITFIKQAQLVQQQTADLLRNVMNASPAGISLMNAQRDADGRLIDFELVLTNEATARIAGRPIADIEGKSVTETFPAYRPLGVYDHYRRVLETGKPDHFEVRYRGDGLDSWIDIAAYPQGDGIVGTFLDITPVRRAQQASQAQQELLQSVLNASLTAIAVYEPIRNASGLIIDFRLTLANQTTLAIFDKPADQLYGQTMLELSPALTNSPAFEHYVTVCETGQPIRMERAANGYYYHVSVARFGSGILSSSIDISENRRYQEQIEQLNATLRASNESLESFAQIASHDLQEPLRKIRSFGDIVLDQYGTYLPEPGRDLLRRMRTAADRMGSLIRDLLTLSRITTQQDTFANLNLGSLVAGVLSDLEALIAEKEADIQLDQLPTLPGSELQLQQLFQNLLSNALKYTRPGVRPVIQLRCERIHPAALPVGLVAKTAMVPIGSTDEPAAYYVFTLSDNGIGFPQEQADRIFGAFQRLHGRNSQYTGTGVGLAIVKRIVDNHKGFIDAHGQMGEGATFRVYLPVFEHIPSLPGQTPYDAGA